MTGASKMASLSLAMAAYSPYKNDVSVPTSKVAAFLVEAKRVLGQSHPDSPVLAWGHLGDGNVHINILKPPQMSVDEFIDFEDAGAEHWSRGAGQFTAADADAKIKLIRETSDEELNDLILSWRRSEVLLLAPRHYYHIERA